MSEYFEKEFAYPREKKYFAQWLGNQKKRKFIFSLFYTQHEECVSKKLLWLQINVVTNKSEQIIWCIIIITIGMWLIY